MDSPISNPAQNSPTSDCDVNRNVHYVDITPGKGNARKQPTKTKPTYVVIDQVRTECIKDLLSGKPTAKQ